EDWLNPSIVLEAFEARSAKMSVECAKRLSRAMLISSPNLFNIFLIALRHTYRFIEKLKGDIPGKGISILPGSENAVALVDAFNYTDHYLGSILGRYDGNVYPNLYNEAWKEPLNDSAVPDGYHEYIRPLLKQQLRNARL
ncbi:Peroxisomal acyl-coenzyme A oxidase 1, partial [Cucurbita argyrosperma subsp. sororia]